MKDKKLMFKIGDIELHLINDCITMVDGGGAFGLVPRKLWQRYFTPDQNNLIPMTQTCLLVKADGKNIYSKLTGTEIIGINEYHIDRITYSNKQFGGKGKTRLDVDKLHKKYSIGKVEKDDNGEDVLRVNTEKTALLKKLKSATSLGNGSHNKVRIFFEDDITAFLRNRKFSIHIEIILHQNHDVSRVSFIIIYSCFSFNKRKEIIGSRIFWKSKRL